MPQDGRQACPQIWDPGGPGEGDLPLVQVDGTRWVTLDLQDTGYAPVRQRIQGDRNRRSS
jgi:hypothetical protein